MEIKVEDGGEFAAAESSESFAPLEYSVGEVCKCYYNEMQKAPSGKVSQYILKCQSFARVLERHPGEKREYTVRLFEPVGIEATRHVPGCCLRKVKVIPFTYEEACAEIGHVVTSSDGAETMMVVSVAKDGESVRVNDITAETMLRDFRFAGSGAPFGRIVMLKADEAFASRLRPCETPA